MRLPRPYIPLTKRIKVARRQLWAQCKSNSTDAEIERAIDIALADRKVRRTQSAELRATLDVLSSDPMHLDHDPALAVRKKIHNSRGQIVGYEPPANSVDHLIYRKATDHQIKTYTRGEGAQYPDRVLIKKIRRIEHPKPKRKYNWPKRKVRP
jgi:hypothetical protein